MYILVDVFVAVAVAADVVDDLRWLEVDAHAKTFQTISVLHEGET